MVSQSATSDLNAGLHQRQLLAGKGHTISPA